MSDSLLVIIFIILSTFLLIFESRTYKRYEVYKCRNDFALFFSTFAIDEHGNIINQNVVDILMEDKRFNKAYADIIYVNEKSFSLEESFAMKIATHMCML